MGREVNRLVMVVVGVALIATLIWSFGGGDEGVHVPKVTAPVQDDKPVKPEDLPMPPEVARSVVVEGGDEAPPELTPPPVPAMQGAAKITGRLVSNTREPIRDAIMRTSIRRGHEYRYADLRTDRDGVFTMELPKDFDGNSRRFYIRTRPTSEFETVWGEGAHVLWPTYPVGLTDIGDITVTALPLLCSGTVRTDAGLHAAGASVYAMPVAVDIKDMQDTHLPEMFRCDPGPDGVFRIFGKHESDKYTVVARAPGLTQTTNLAIDPGATDVKLVMAAGGKLSGSVVLGSHLDPAYVYVDLVGTAVEGHIGDVDKPLSAAMRPLSKKSRLRLRVDALGRFEASNLRDGTLQCSVHVIGRAHAIADVASVQIKSGATCADPRLQKVDLSDLRPTTLTFTPAPGDAAVRSMNIGIKEASQPQWGQRSVPETGKLTVVTKGPFDVVIQQCGYQRSVVEGIAGDRTIELQQGLKTRVKAKLGNPFSPDYITTIQLVGAGPASGPGSAATRVPGSGVWPITNEEAVTLTVPTPGRYKAVIRVALKGGSASQSIAVTGVSPAEVTIAAGVEGVEHVFELPNMEAFRCTQVLDKLFKRGSHYAPK